MRLDGIDFTLYQLYPTEFIRYFFMIDSVGKQAALKTDENSLNSFKKSPVSDPSDNQNEGGCKRGGPRSFFN